LILRKTQDPAFWREEFSITPADLQYISTLLIENELPAPADELGRALVLHRYEEEEALIRRAASRGTPYRPALSYEVGEDIVFPVLDYRLGSVVRLRDGHNPEYGEFKVVQVEFENGQTREFASELAEHPLNDDSAPVQLADAQLKSGEDLAREHGETVGVALESLLESDPHFVRLAGEWFRRDLLVEVHVGHLNLAEAVLDMNDGGPMPTEALIGDLELPEEISPQLRVFSLNYALQEDERFDEVGPAGEVLWFLNRLEPEGARTPPRSLLYRGIEYDRTLLTSEMLALERELDDEWSEFPPPAAVPEPVTVVLTYPHWRYGAIPLSSRLMKVFPTARTQRIHFTFVDGDTGEEMTGWVVRGGRYVFGLKEWYETNKVPVGAYLDLSRSAEPGKVIVRRRRRRPRREWVRVALAVDAKLTFEMRQTRIPCEYDDLMVLEEEYPGAGDVVSARARARRLTLPQAVSELFPELVKLSPQGTVHAASLYSAINLLVRTPPGPVFAELVVSEQYSPIGDNYWVLAHGPGRG
jgi:hypothetical protein